MAFLGQFLASLVAILLLAWLARRLGLGHEIRIRDEDHAITLADEVICGFEAQQVTVDETGRAALVRDAQDRIILIKLHGAQFAGRLLGHGSSARIWEDRGHKSLEIDSGESLFGKAFLTVRAPEDWVNAVNAARVSTDA